MTKNISDILERFDKFKIKEYGKWKIGRIETKQFIAKEIKELLEEQKKEIKLAKQCLNYKGFYCYHNKDCLNDFCPLNSKKKIEEAKR